MENKSSAPGQDLTLVKQFGEFMSYLPFINLCSGVFSAFFGLQRGWDWQWRVGLYTLLPFLLISLVFFAVSAFYRWRYQIAIPFFNKRVRWPALLAAACLLLLNLCMAMA